MSALKIIKPYEKKNRLTLSCKDKTLTKQSMREECDINVIVKMYDKTGQMNYVNPLPPQFGDNPSVTFTEAMHIVQEAEEMFMQMPSAIRAEFNNQPAAFLDFVNDPGNEDEMRDMGILPKKFPGSGSPTFEKFDEIPPKTKSVSPKPETVEKPKKGQDD